MHNVEVQLSSSGEVLHHVEHVLSEGCEAIAGNEQTDVTLTTISPEALCSTTSNAATAPSCRAHLHMDIWPAPLPVICSRSDVSNR